MTEVEILKVARALIEDPRRWSQDALAFDAHGLARNPLVPDAVRWCAVGAVCRAANHPFYEQKGPERWLTEAAHGLGYEEAAELNDTAEHSTVLRMFDRAIELAEQAQC